MNQEIILKSFWKGNKIRRIILAAIFMICLTWGEAVEAGEKITVGLVEEVRFLTGIGCCGWQPALWR